MTPLDEIRAERLIAVLRAPSAAAAVETARALASGGVRIIEVAFTTPDAATAIRGLREGTEDIVVGAGTVLGADRASAAIDAGAAFLVSPCIDETVAGMAARHDVPVIPGALTPGEVARAMQLSAVVKLFPADVAGPAYAEALRQPFPQLQYIPTGGVTEQNVERWLEAGAVAVGVGGDLCPSSAIGQGAYGEIERRASRYRALIDRS